jgi:hypothetical protein
VIGSVGDLLKRVDAVVAPVAGPVATAVRPRRHATTDRLLVVRPGGMGDLILAQLAAEQLGLDTQAVRWLIESRSAAWARHLGLDHMAYDTSPLSVVADIAGRYQRVVNTEQRFGLSMAAALWARARPGRLTAFATNRVARQADALVSYDWNRAHELDEFGRLLATATGRSWPGRRPVTRRKDSDGTWVVSLGGTHSASRALSVDDWRRFLRSVAGDRPLVLTAGPLEDDLASALVAALDGQADRFRGSFDDVIERIATAERLVAVDGGTVHIASYYGVPTDALFTAGRSSKWSPLAPGSIVHRRDDLHCQPCTIFGQVPPCPYNFRCRADIPSSLGAFPVSLELGPHDH